MDMKERDSNIIDLLNIKYGTFKSNSEITFKYKKKINLGGAEMRFSNGPFPGFLWEFSKSRGSRLFLALKSRRSHFNYI